MKTLQVYTRARTTVFFTRHVEVPDDFPEADYGDVVRRLCGHMARQDFEEFGELDVLDQYFIVVPNLPQNCSDYYVQVTGDSWEIK
jgi:hypothetical protein